MAHLLTKANSIRLNIGGVNKYYMEQDIRLSFGKRLKQLRRKKGITQVELAQKTGIDYKYIQRLEGKKPSSVTITTLVKFAKAFKITPSKLLNFPTRGSR